MMYWSEIEKLWPPTSFLDAILPKKHLEELFHFRQCYNQRPPLEGRLCFSSCACRAGVTTGAAVASPVLLGVCSGPTLGQVPEFDEGGAPSPFCRDGMRTDPSELPRELLGACRELAMSQLLPDAPLPPQDAYKGPIALLKDAYRATESVGSATVLLAVLDNGSMIHGKPHPMVAVLSAGNCELLVLRRLLGPQGELEVVFHPDPQSAEAAVRRGPVGLRTGEESALETIEEQSLVHCVSACEGDVVVLGDEHVFGSLFLHEVVALCNEALPPTSQPGLERSGLLTKLAQRIAHEACSDGGSSDCPALAGAGASVVVAEVIQWAASLNTPPLQRNAMGFKLWECGADTCGRAGPECLRLGASTGGAGQELLGEAPGIQPQELSVPEHLEPAPSVKAACADRLLLEAQAGSDWVPGSDLTMREVCAPSTRSGPSGLTWDLMGIPQESAVRTRGPWK